MTCAPAGARRKGRIVEECLFCRIASGEISANIVYEDDGVVAFDDISPQAPVHTLVIPRTHYDNMSDGVSPEAMAEVFGVVPEVARLKGVDESGYRVIVNNGPDANQTVGHLHVHIIGGSAMSHGMVQMER